jgi:hypothetical protein
VPHEHPRGGAIGEQVDEPVVLHSRIDPEHAERVTFHRKPPRENDLFAEALVVPFELRKLEFYRGAGELRRQRVVKRRVELRVRRPDEHHRRATGRSSRDGK